MRKKIFIPIVLGGNIKNIETVKNYFKFGADKILINSLSFYYKDLIKKISNSYGSQSISIMIDYKRFNNKIDLYSNHAEKLQSINLNNHLLNINNLNCGEIILNSIDNDGNGAGLDYEITKEIPKNIKKPILLMGGAGKPNHICLALKNKKIFGVVTANLFNFLGTGLKDTRDLCVSNKIQLALFQELY